MSPSTGVKWKASC